MPLWQRFASSFFIRLSFSLHWRWILNGRFVRMLRLSTVNTIVVSRFLFDERNKYAKSRSERREGKNPAAQSTVHMERKAKKQKWKTKKWKYAAIKNSYKNSFIAFHAKNEIVVSSRRCSDQWKSFTDEKKTQKENFHFLGKKWKTSYHFARTFVCGAPLIVVGRGAAAAAAKKSKHKSKSHQCKYLVQVHCTYFQCTVHCYNVFTAHFKWYLILKVSLFQRMFAIG